MQQVFQAALKYRWIPFLSIAVVVVLLAWASLGGYDCLQPCLTSACAALPQRTLPKLWRGRPAALDKQIIGIHSLIWWFEYRRRGKSSSLAQLVQQHILLNALISHRFAYRE